MDVWQVLAEAWLVVATLQREAMGNMASALRGGDGVGLAGLAAGLGALYALTPGHGKAALAAFIAGGRIGMGRALAMAGTAAAMHVVTGAALYFVLYGLLRRTPNLWGRGEPGVVFLGYSLVALAGVIMILQAWRTRPAGTASAITITAGIGVLPCPLTISVLGFTLSQSSMAWAVLALLSLAVGVATTIGTVALLTVLFRTTTEHLVRRYADRFASVGKWLQTVTGGIVVVIALVTMLSVPV